MGIMRPCKALASDGCERDTGHESGYCNKHRVYDAMDKTRRLITQLNRDVENDTLTKNRLKNRLHEFVAEMDSQAPEIFSKNDLKFLLKRLGRGKAAA